MKVLKFMSNDYILYLINFFILYLIYLNYILNQNYNLFIEILIICVIYYFISLIISFTIVFLLFLKVRKKLGKDMLLVSKLKLVANIFNEFFDEIHCIEDLELKLNS